MADRYSDDDVTDAAIRALVAHAPKFRAVCALAWDVRHEAIGDFTEDAPVSAPDLQALVGSKIREAHGESIAGMMADSVNWAEVGAEVLKTITGETDA